MKHLSIAVLIFVLSSFIQRDKVELKIDTDPGCLKRGRAYDFTTDADGLGQDEFLVLNGKGLLISRSEGGWSMMVPETAKDGTVALSVCKRKKGSNQTRFLKKFVFEICE